ncbi:MAG: pseudouridine synthase [Lachnospiraceae bacterium]|nr:pseudouridine synthase [Lachnospiraceae bacterium]
MAQMRLDKFLGEMGVGTRTQIKEIARKGRVLVNGRTEKKSDRKIDPEADRIQVDGREISYAAWEYYMLNKPQGVVSATEDGLHQTVIDLLTEAKRKNLFPVGRLDIDTEGLLLITNDGDLAHRLLSPKKHVDKVYYAKVEGALPADSVRQMELGITLEDGTKTLPAKLEILGPVPLPRVQEETDAKSGASVGTEIRLTIREGRFHQVKRMFEALGCRVVFLKRLSMGTLRLDEHLLPGQYRPLTEEELEKLKSGNTE